MKKKEKLVKIVAVFLSILTILALGHTYYSLYGLDLPNFAATGNVVQDPTQDFSNINLKGKLIIAGEWMLIILASIYLLVKGKIKAEHDFKNLENLKLPALPQRKPISKTDLDTLYELLKEKKRLPVSILIKYFKVDQNIIINWGNVLEEANLATVHYPTVGDPIITLNEGKPNENS